MFLFDTIGIGLFTIIGINISMQHNLDPLVCLIMGIVSACFGGVIRDVLTNEIPLIFREQIYASACLIGGLVYLSFSSFTTLENLNVVLSICIVILIRYLSIKFNWSLNFTTK